MRVTTVVMAVAVLLAVVLVVVVLAVGRLWVVVAVTLEQVRVAQDAASIGSA
jgi:hypothetical protein